MTDDQFIAVILAGGQGQRLYPISTVEKPKQFLKLDGSNQSQLQTTVTRLVPICGDMNNVFVVTLERYQDEVIEHLPAVPQENLILEPQMRGTAPAVCLALAMIRNRFRDGDLIGFFPSDHWIGDFQGFQNSLEHAKQIIQAHDKIVLFGIQPQFASSQFGWIELGQQLDHHNAFEVQAFVEKPETSTAQTLFKSESMLWNSGMLLASIRVLRQTLETHFNAPFSKIDRTVNPPNLRDSSSLVDVYESLKPVSFDQAVLTHLPPTICLRVDYPWLDLGSFEALKALP